METVVALGGAISGEHGIGLAKTPFLRLQHRAAQVKAMQAVKKALDPRGILNPGKMFAKALRGGKMQDVIFEGADTRKAAQLCEVSLLLTDCEKQLGSEFHEIEITRRVHRDGQSEYSFNGQACRLKDIQKLFMDTGVGRTSYSIMAQGQIDQILSSKPEERRAVFEEAAGITKYKSRAPRGDEQARADRPESGARGRRDRRSRPADRQPAAPGGEGDALQAAQFPPAPPQPRVEQPAACPADGHAERTGDAKVSGAAHGGRRAPGAASKRSKGRSRKKRRGAAG